MCSSPKIRWKFLIFTFYETKQMSLTQDLRWSLEWSIALQLQSQTNLFLCTVNCFPQWAHPQNMAVGDLTFYYTLYLWVYYVFRKKPVSKNLLSSYCNYLDFICINFITSYSYTFHVFLKLHLNDGDVYVIQYLTSNEIFNLAQFQWSIT